ncbi:protein-lysine methyltransferase METTL21B-like protein [Corchorus capsularis]|uniref:Protein-lysine methyltransferase METTL21B-like protein n=1 Tax=Corchorus capsularis TaxID=210143 RepID=A0A1R3J2N0_COCAP|nr:protein-lysine methyltransferase METTL21B-like protein [Corchorus capsularis]
MARQEEEEEDIVCLDESFFRNDDYKLTTFTFGSHVLQLFCLQSACTDFDLTGQLLLRNSGRGHCKFILAYVSRAKMMDTMVIKEANQHGMLINEVAGTRSVVGNLEGVIFEITLC